MQNGNQTEVRLPYFTDVYKMHWFAQPFAIACNFILSLVYLAVIVLFFALYGIAAVCAFVLFIPFILLSETYNWIRGWFKYK